MLRTLALLASSAGLLLLLAGHFASEAFVTSSLKQGRDLSVGRAVSHSGYAQARYQKEIREMNDEELHDVIAFSRQKLLRFRLEKFRKMKPSAGMKYEWQYKIALAKTFLKERERAALAGQEVTTEPLSKDFPARLTLAEQMKQDEDLELAKAEWHDIGGWGSRPVGSKVDNYPPQVGFDKRYYKLYGKLYDAKKKTEKQSGWSWDPKLSKRPTVFPPDDYLYQTASKETTKPEDRERVRWWDTFDKDSIDIHRARKAKAAAEAFATEKATGPSSATLFAGAALLGFMAVRGRRL